MTGTADPPAASVICHLRKVCVLVRVHAVICVRGCAQQGDERREDEEDEEEVKRAK